MTIAKVSQNPSAEGASQNCKEIVKFLEAPKARAIFSTYYAKNNNEKDQNKSDLA